MHADVDAQAPALARAALFPGARLGGGVERFEVARLKEGAGGRRPARVRVCRRLPRGTKRGSERDTRASGFTTPVPFSFDKLERARLRRSCRGEGRAGERSAGRCSGAGQRVARIRGRRTRGGMVRSGAAAMRRRHGGVRAQAVSHGGRGLLRCAPCTTPLRCAPARRSPRADHPEESARCATMPREDTSGSGRCMGDHCLLHPPLSAVCCCAVC